MKKKYIIPIIVILLLSISQSSYSQQFRGLYVNSFDEILGNPELEQKLFDYVSACNFNSLTLYSLYKIDLTELSNRTKLRSFIRKAKTQYGIVKVGSAAENIDHFKRELHDYNVDPITLDEEKINVYNLEFEFWSDNATSGYYCTKYLERAGLPCTPEGGLIFVKRLLIQMKELAEEVAGVETEIYLGWTDEEECREIAGIVDRVLVAVYRKEDSEGNINLYNFPSQLQRLKWLSVLNNKLKIAPIFSSHYGSSEYNLQNWLVSGGSICEAWENYFTGYLNDTASWTNQINLMGYQWFKYTSMPEIETIGSIGQIIGPSEIYTGESHNYSVPEVPDVDSYVWSLLPGAHIIRSNDSGSSLYIRFDSIVSDTISVHATACCVKTVTRKLAVQVRDKSLSTKKQVINNDILIIQDNNSVNIHFPDISRSEGIIRIHSLNGKQLYYFDNSRTKNIAHDIDLSRFVQGINIITIISGKSIFQKKVYISD